jgi:anti-anti-sigma factor
MPVTALLEVRRVGGLPLLPFPQSVTFRAAARELLTAARTLRQLPGFRRWQAFRAMDASDTLLLLVDWDSVADLNAGLDRLEVERCLERAEGWGLEVEITRSLPATFDRALSADPGVATLLRLATQEGTGRMDVAAQVARVESDLALQALAAPSSLRVHGGLTGRKSLCRLEFDSEDGIWHFLESPLRKRWERTAELAEAHETWAINLPRLERGGVGPRPDAPRPRPVIYGSLSVGFSYRDDSRAALRLEGVVDARGAVRCEQLCEFVLREGCQRLEVDVSGLQLLEHSLLGLLARTARTLRARGGEFVVIDNEARVKRVTRTRHLEASVS